MNRPLKPSHTHVFDYEGSVRLIVMNKNPTLDWGTWFWKNPAVMLRFRDLVKRHHNPYPTRESRSDQ